VRRRTAIAVAVVVVVAAGAWWNTGAMDSALVHLGLNRNECAQNGFGNWFCGDALKQMQHEAAKAKRESDTIDRKLAEEERKQAKLEAEQRKCMKRTWALYPTWTEAEAVASCEEEREWKAANRRYREAGYKTYPEGHPCTLPEVYPEAKCCIPENRSAC
jgi:hypothetical protein